MKKLIRALTFFILLFFIVMGLNRLTMKKTMQEVGVCEYGSIYKGLCDLPSDSLDVLYIGSSHVFSSVSPEDIFHDYGITGYVVSTSCQKIFQSYYFTEDVFRTQHPKVVVLDCFMLGDATPQSEPFNREAIDAMPLTIPKLKQIECAANLNPQQEHFWSYIFPVIRYHDRWTELNQADYSSILSLKDNYVTKGFLPREGSVEAAFDEEQYLKEPIGAQLPEKNQEYLVKMNELCNKNGSELVLVKYPSCLWSFESSQAVKNWADANNVKYLDFNADQDLRNEVSVDWQTDSLDGGNHLNYDGAMKMSPVLAEYLINNYTFDTEKSAELIESWENDYKVYKKCVFNNHFKSQSNWREYIDMILSDDYVVFVSFQNMDMSNATELCDGMARLGIIKDFSEGSVGLNNIVLYDSGNIIESRLSKETLFYKTRLSDKTKVAIKQSGDSEKKLEYSIGERNYTVNEQGIIFIIYDKNIGDVVDVGIIKQPENERDYVLVHDNH